MTNLVPDPNWSDVRQLEANEYATGGAGGNMNEQALALTARTGYLDKYTASPYRTGKVYDLNERVQLENGDIVKSTIAENTANPNSDMTGWVKINDASQVIDASGVLCALKSAGEGPSFLRTDSFPCRPYRNPGNNNLTNNRGGVEKRVC